MDVAFKGEVILHRVQESGAGVLWPRQIVITPMADAFGPRSEDFVDTRFHKKYGSSIWEDGLDGFFP
jgi:hypothetical protein